MAQQKIEDFGEHIGGAKKEIWRLRNMLVSDLDDIELKEYLDVVTKDNIWKAPDYVEMCNTRPVEVAYFIRHVREKLKPKTEVVGDGQDRRRAENYIKFVENVRNLCETLRTTDDCKNLAHNIKQLYKNSSGTWTSEVYYTPGMENKFFKDISTDLRHLFVEARVQGFPHDFRGAYKGVKIRQRGEKWFILLNTTNYDLRHKFMDKSFDSLDDAISFCRSDGIDILDESKTTKKVSKLFKVVRPQLERIERKGPNLAPVLEKHYGHQSMTGELLMQTFKFRGGEFGNWNTQDDRLAYLHYAFDAFMDLAYVLEYSVNNIGLRPSVSHKLGAIAIAFGSRGSGTALAHYEPARRVINLTKMKGAGSLAHEFGHAFDDTLGIACGLSGLSTFLSECAVDGVISKRRYKSDNQDSVEVEAVREAMANVMNVIRSTPASASSLVKLSSFNANIEFGELADDIRNRLGFISVLKTPKDSYCVSKDISIYTESNVARHATEICSLLQKALGLVNILQHNMQSIADIMKKKSEAAIGGLPISDQDVQKLLATYEKEIVDMLDTVCDIQNMLESAAQSMKTLEDAYGHVLSSTTLDNLRNHAAYLRLSLRNLINVKKDITALYDMMCGEDYKFSTLTISVASRRRASKFYESAKKLDSGRKKAYYSRGCEMFARCFESYIEDMLKQNGIVSQYLVHSTHSELYEDIPSPYPQGEERERINEAISKLIKVALPMLFYNNDKTNEYKTAYNNPNNWESYSKNIIIEKKSPKKITKTASGYNIESAKDIRQVLSDIAKNSLKTSPLKVSTIYGIVNMEELINRLAVVSQMKLGYAGAGFNSLKKSKLPAQGNSKAYLITELPGRGKVIMIESDTDPEKQVEGMLEALTYTYLSIRGNASRGEMLMLVEGVTYMLCKRYGLDVRTYCKSPNFEALSKDSNNVNMYIKLCNWYMTDMIGLFS